MSESEREFQRRVEGYARLQGWRVYSVPDSRQVKMRGYPDLTMWRSNDKRLIFAELKAEKGRLRPDQEIVLADLRELEFVEVYLWRPSDWDSIVKILKKVKR